MQLASDLSFGYMPEQFFIPARVKVLNNSRVVYLQSKLRQNCSTCWMSTIWQLTLQNYQLLIVWGAGATANTLRRWEEGTRRPSGPAKRLIWIIAEMLRRYQPANVMPFLLTWGIVPLLERDQYEQKLRDVYSLVSDEADPNDRLAFMASAYDRSSSNRVE